MQVLILDGHPDSGRLGSVLLDDYSAGLPPGTTVTRLAVRDLEFDASFRGRKADPPCFEPDLARLWSALAACDHLVLCFPLWWGAEPARLKALFERLFQPGYGFRYHDADSGWDRYLTGRSCDVVITMDSPVWYVRWICGDPIGRRLRRQVLGFCGLAPLRFFYVGPVRSNPARILADWRPRLARAARSAARIARAGKVTSPAVADLSRPMATFTPNS